jgi:hypothetical protein
MFVIHGCDIPYNDHRDEECNSWEEAFSKARTWVLDSNYACVYNTSSCRIWFKQIPGPDYYRSNGDSHVILWGEPLDGIEEEDEGPDLTQRKTYFCPVTSNFYQFWQEDK